MYCVLVVCSPFSYAAVTASSGCLVQHNNQCQATTSGYTENLSTLKAQPTSVIPVRKPVVNLNVNMCCGIKHQLQEGVNNEERHIG